jgi:hypothetical protein
MNHHETLAMAEQHRADLIQDAVTANRYRRRAGRRTRRQWFGRRHDTGSAA